jgi:chemotaxis protein MotB
MAVARSRRVNPRTEYWPSFVDVLTNLLLVFIFLLSIFAVVQYLLSREVSTRDTVLTRLNAQIDELTSMLALEKATTADLTDNAATLQATLSLAEGERARLQGLLGDQTTASASASQQIASLTASLDDEKQISQRSLAQVELLNQQISALRRQLSAVQSALESSEAKNRDSQVQIADLGQRLNIALAQRVEELTRYRSDFFGRLNQILGNRPDIQVVGDRFVLQSEVLFDTGSDVVKPAAVDSLTKIATAVSELSAQIPPEIAWVIRVDGHTDRRPIIGGQLRFRSNWELSAARAISVVQFLVGRGIPANRLVAAGFGEFQPLDAGDSDAALAKNRRIELKLTER